jgi:hypothetical protein
VPSSTRGIESGADVHESGSKGTDADAAEQQRIVADRRRENTFE